MRRPFRMISIVLALCAASLALALLIQSQCPKGPKRKGGLASAVDSNREGVASAPPAVYPGPATGSDAGAEDTASTEVNGRQVTLSIYSVRALALDTEEARKSVEQTQSGWGFGKLVTSAPLIIRGKQVSAGTYFFKLHKIRQGIWSLALIKERGTESTQAEMAEMELEEKHSSVYLPREEVELKAVNSQVELTIRFADLELTGRFEVA
jgi:hypothetical protein